MTIQFRAELQETPAVTSQSLVTAYAADGETKLETTKEIDVDFELVVEFVYVFASVLKVVHEHGMRKKVNSINSGKFSFFGFEAELTVPQLRALLDIVPLLP